MDPVDLERFQERYWSGTLTGEDVEALVAEAKQLRKDVKECYDDYWGGSN